MEALGHEEESEDEKLGDHSSKENARSQMPHIPKYCVYKQFVSFEDIF